MVGTDLGDLGKTGDLGTWVADEAVGMAASLLARADDCDVDPAVGGSVSLGCPYVGGQNERGGTEGGLLEEFSTVGHVSFSGC